MLTLESQVNSLFFNLHHFFSCLSYFNFSYQLYSAQVSPDCPTLGHPNKLMEG